MDPYEMTAVLLLATAFLLFGIASPHPIEEGPEKSYPQGVVIEGSPGQSGPQAVKSPGQSVATDSPCSTRRYCHDYSTNITNTCCPVNEYTIGCCPQSNAVCCSDKEHCCPKGLTCNLNIGSCTSPDATQDKMSYRDDPKCPPHTTYCATGEPGLHSCCPTSGHTCHAAGCVPDATKPLLPLDIYRVCPDGFLCHPDQVCCLRGWGVYKCCPVGYLCSAFTCFKSQTAA